MLSNNTDQKTRLSLACYDFDGPAAALASFGRQTLADIFSFAGPIKTINLWIDDPETADLTQAGFISGGSYEVFDRNFRFQYRVASAANFGLTEKDIKFLQQAEHGSYYYVCFDSKHGRSLVLIWICQEPGPAAKRRVANQWREYHSRIIKPSVNEVYLDTSELSSDSLIYFVVLEGNYNVNISLETVKAQGRYHKFDPRYPLYIRPHTNMWIAFLQDELPLRVSDVIGDGYEKFRSRNGIFHIELQSKKAWHGVIRIKLKLQDPLPPPPPAPPVLIPPPTEADVALISAIVCTASVRNINHAGTLLISSVVCEATATNTNSATALLIVPLTCGATATNINSATALLTVPLACAAAAININSATALLTVQLACAATATNIS